MQASKVRTNLSPAGPMHKVSSATARAAFGIAISDFWLVTSFGASFSDRNNVPTKLAR